MKWVFLRKKTNRQKKPKSEQNEERLGHMRVVFMGTPDFAVETLEAIAAAGHTVEGVVTQPDKPVGRSRKLQPTPVKAAALAHGFPVWQPERVRDEAFFQVLKACAPDVIVVAAFGQILSKEILTLPKYGCLNVHASLLPKYRGAAPVQWAVIDGETYSGVTIMQMDEGLDTGDMLARIEIRLAGEETGGSLFDRLSVAGAELMAKFLNRLEQEGETALHPEPQPKKSPTPYARMITKKDGEIDWTKDAVSLERLVRGLDPWPSAYTFWKGKSLKLWRTAVCREHSAEGQPEKKTVPGTVIRTGEKEIFVQTGDGILSVLELQMEGKKRMSAEEFLRGRAIPAGTVLGRG